jgi:hypothetical protein
MRTPYLLAWTRAILTRMSVRAEQMLRETLYLQLAVAPSDGPVVPVIGPQGQRFEWTSRQERRAVEDVTLPDLG